MSWIWPFKPRDELIEALEWRTDIIRAKNGEQRIALRSAPRRHFQMRHTMTDYYREVGSAIIRNGQGALNFDIPDWTQATRVPDVLNQSVVTLDFDPQYFDFSDQAMIWEDENKFERVDVEQTSSGIEISGLTRNYAAPYITPIWAAVCPDGFESQRIGANLNQFTATFITTENNDIGASDYPQYRDHDIVTDCPVIGSGTLSEFVSWETSDFDSAQNEPVYIRQYAKPLQRFTMRWHAVTDADQWTLRRFLHSRRGRQKAFWLSTTSKDLQPVADINGTNLQVYILGGSFIPGYTQSFDLEIKLVDGTVFRRQVTAITLGAEVGGRQTWDMTLDTAVIEGSIEIQRVSYLHCVRFDADRIELLHRAVVGMTVQVPCLEINIP